MQAKKIVGYRVFGFGVGSRRLYISKHGHALNATGDVAQARLFPCKEAAQEFLARWRPGLTNRLARVVQKRKEMLGHLAAEFDEAGKLTGFAGAPGFVTAEEAARLAAEPARYRRRAVRVYG